MDKNHKMQRHRIQALTECVMGTTSPGRNDLNEGTRGRAKVMLLLVVVLVAARPRAYAIDAPERTNVADAVLGSNPLLLTPTAAQPPRSPAGAGTVSANMAGARIQFATPVHDFGKVRGGEVVKYTYAFTNIGDSLLEVTGVRTSCGCTTAGDWSRKVEPGQAGSIPIQFNTGNFSGQVAKSITVTCNATNQPTVVLQLKATIWKAIDVSPQFAVLNVTADGPSNPAIVRIVSNEDAPLTLSAPEITNRAFAVELRTNQPGKEFQLIINTVPPLSAGNVQGQITMKTSSTNMPVINVRAWANVQQAVLVTPSQITLPAGPLAKAMPYIISIRNNETNTLTLSEPTLNARGVDVQLKEIQPGRYFSLTATFPVGIELPQGENVELTVKSSHPRFPTIKVPVRQLPHPAPVAVSAPVPQPPGRAPAAVPAPPPPPPLPPGTGN